MSRRQRSATKQAQRARVARAKVLRRRGRTRRAATVAASAVTLAAAGTAGSVVPASGVDPTAARSSQGALLDCSGAPMPSYWPEHLTEFDGKLFFTASDAYGEALWRSDGTKAGTVLIKRVGKDDDYPYGHSNIVAVGDRLFFTTDGDGSEGLWRSDGTRSGTVLVRRFAEGNSAYDDGGPEQLTAVGDTLFFTGTDAVHGAELWRTNGTPSGTVRVKDIQPRHDKQLRADDRPLNLTAVRDTLFFTADDGTRGEELWKSDGTRAGTHLVKDIRTGARGSDPGSLAAVGPTLLFAARDGVHGNELWKSDGTKAGTVLVKDIGTGGEHGSPYALTRVGGRVFFNANDATDGNDLWISDGRAAGTVKVKNLRPDGPHHLTAVGGTLFFAAGNDAMDGDGNELWKSDGTASGTVMVEDIKPGNYGSYPVSLTAVGGTLFFTAGDGDRWDLWRSDGTEAGTYPVRPGSGSGDPGYLAAVGGRVFFTDDLDSTTGKRELWVSDGTEAGTHVVPVVNRGAMEVGSRVWTTAGNSAARVLATFDSAGTVQVAPARKGGIRNRYREVAGDGRFTRTLTLELTRTAQRTLRRTGRVEIGARFTFTSCAGAVTSVTRSYTLRKR